MVFAGLGVSVALVLAISLYVYQRHVQYVPRAAKHMPSDFSLALRLDVEKGVVYGPFREHFLPLLEAGRTGAVEGDSRLDALRRATTIELGVDLREVGIALDRGGSWLLLLGGHFPVDGVVTGVLGMLTREGIPVRKLDGPERLIHPSGAAFGVSAEGVLIVAQTQDVLLRALREDSPRPELGAGSALSLAFGRALEAESSALSGARLQVRAGQTFEAELLLPRVPAGTDDAALGALLSGKTGDFKLLSGAQTWRMSPLGGGGQRAVAQLSRAEFDQLVASVASGLGRLMGLPPGKTAGDAP